MKRRTTRTSSRPASAGHSIRALALGLTLLAASPAFAQNGAPQAERPAPPKSSLRRWLDVQTAALYLRYRVIETSAGVVSTNQLQHREATRLRVKFDAQGRYSLYAGLFTGSAFTSSWNTTGAGTGEPTGHIYLKQLYASASPLKSLELQVGGIYVIRGENTEITSYDDDGYLVGGRVSVHEREHLFFDEISGTLANIGHFQEPNVFTRFEDLDTVNYRQILVGRRIGKAIATSIDYTDAAGAGTVRGGIVLTSHVPLGLDAIWLELYRRVTAQSSGGLAVAADRAVTRRIRMGGGYANIDPNYGGLNGDRYNRGQRWFVTGALTLSRDLALSCFFTHAFHNDFPVSIGTRFDTVLTYNVLNPLRRAGVLSPRFTPQR